ncbi:hypothetical protein [Streptomyces sp. NPDC051554]|uniref:hypothetical protein n=1 Tax=Streptomyces sp. NPDC051554 TaxID=3365656 RepID=UPI0037917150
MKITTVWRALMAFVKDIVLGSVLLARRMKAGTVRAYRGLQGVAEPAATVKNRPGDAKGEEPAEKKAVPTATPAMAPISASDGEAPAGQESERATAKKKAGKRKGGGKKRRARLETWTPVRMGGAAFGAWVVYCFTHRPLEYGWRALAPDLVALLPWVAVWWTVAAWLTAQYDRNSRHTAGTDPATDGETGPHAGEARSAAPDTAVVRAAGLWLLHLVCTRVSAAVAEGRKGVHLATLIDEGAVPEAWTVEALREHCGRLGIPVKTMQIRGSGRGPTHGVHADELVAALGAPLTAATSTIAQLLADASQNLTPETAPGALPAPPTETLPEASPEGAPEPVAGVAPGRAEEAPAGPRKGVPFERLLGAWFAGRTGPTRTPGHTPPPNPAPASPGRG